MSQAVATVPQFILFSTLYDTSQTVAEFLEVVAQDRSPKDDTSDLQDILAKSQQLYNRIQTLMPILPPVFAYEKVKRFETAISIPEWLQHTVKGRHGPTCFHRSYFNINIANCWNWMRQCLVRILELQYVVSSRLGVQSDFQEIRLLDIESLADEMNSTILYFLVGDDDGELSYKTKIEDVRGIRGFFLMRSIVSSQMALEFIQRRGVDVANKIEWLKDVCQLLKREFGIEAPDGPDPMDID